MLANEINKVMINKELSKSTFATLPYLIIQKVRIAIIRELDKAQKQNGLK
jgi:hypothetical protein